MIKLLLATKNPGKVREIKEILKDIQMNLISLDEIEFNDDIAETGKTFEENAIIKAKTIGEKTGILTMAEDSGLVVDALGGRPGIHSARYTVGSDTERINKLLRELKGIPKGKRTARYKAVVVIYDPKTKKINTFSGECEGYITEKPIGINGFGYDPVFYCSELDKTNGEALSSEKNRVSHRYKALSQTRKILEDISYKL